MSSQCPKCGEGLRWLSGSPAHPDNLYCEQCDYKAWERETVSGLRRTIAKAQELALDLGVDGAYTKSELDQRIEQACREQREAECQELIKLVLSSDPMLGGIPYQQWLKMKLSKRLAILSASSEGE